MYRKPLISERYGFEPHPIEGDSVLYPDHYAIVVECDIRKQYGIRGTLVVAHDGEYLFTLSRRQLEKLYSAWESKFYPENADFEIDAEMFYPADDGY